MSWSIESERLSLRHPGLAHAFDDAIAYREIDGIVAKVDKEASDPCNGQLRIEGERSSGRSPRLIRTAENRQCRREKDMAHWIVAVSLDGSPQPEDRLLVATEVDLGGADEHQPKEGPCITRTKPQRLLDMSLGLLGSAEIQLSRSDYGVCVGKVPIERQRPLAFGNSLLSASGDTKDHAQTIVGEGMVRSQ